MTEYFVILEHQTPMDSKLAVVSHVNGPYGEFPTEEQISEVAERCDFVTIEKRYESIPFA